MTANKLAREAWNNWSDNCYERDLSDYDIIEAAPVRAFPHEAREMLSDALPGFPDLKGKTALVPSSGDNIATFGFHLLGAGFELCDYRDMQSHRDDIGSHAWFGTPEENTRDDYAVYDWRKNPWAALPSWMGMRLRKKYTGGYFA